MRLTSLIVLLVFLIVLSEHYGMRSTANLEEQKSMSTSSSFLSEQLYDDRPIPLATPPGLRVKPTTRPVVATLDH